MTNAALILLLVAPSWSLRTPQHTSLEGANVPAPSQKLWGDGPNSSPLNDMLSAMELVRQPDGREASVSQGESSSSSHGEATVQMYVMNLKGRPERWECAQTQMKDAPYNYTRFESVTPKSLKHECPYWSNAESYFSQGKPAASLMCSQVKIWETELTHGTSDFVIIFEDDIVFAKEVWDTVHDLVNGPCKDSFDYLAFDTYFVHHGRHRIVDDHLPTSKEKKGQELCHGAAGTFNLYTPPWGAGAHMTIFRRSKLQNFLDVVKKATKNRSGKMAADQINSHEYPKEGYQIRAGYLQAAIAGPFEWAHTVGVDPAVKCQNKHIGKSSLR